MQIPNQKIIGRVYATVAKDIRLHGKFTAVPMKRYKLLFNTIVFLHFFASCRAQELPLHVKYPGDLKTGAELTEDYLPLLQNKTIGIVANHTSRIGNTHVVDSLLSLGVRIKCVYAPEHGFRGEAGAGEKISDGKDERSGLPVVSLYGKHMKPDSNDLAGIDLVVFDIQDVGARFYTYISTLQYVMEACAEKGIGVMVLDRPNPNGFYVDGPVLKKEYKSFVGMQSVPVVYGMTMGEYAKMLNGERWLAGGKSCELKVIRMRDYTHTDLYQLPVSPSPNLPNMSAVYLYPSLCFFEGTRVSVGRGTTKPFQLIGFPGYRDGDTAFTPVSIPGVAPTPPYRDTLCNGLRLTGFEELYPKKYRQIYLYWLLAMARTYPDTDKFFIDFFNKLSGNSELMQQVKNGMQESVIRDTWKSDLASFKKIRKKYLLYQDFE